MPAPALERPLPHNLDAERSVLGAILLDNHALNAAVELLRPEDFFLEQHRRLFHRMVALAEQHQAIDPVTLAEELERHGELQAAGGAAYLAQLMEGVPRTTHVEHYARIVKEKALLRNLIHVTEAIQQQALEADRQADEILDRAESLIFQLAEDRVRTGLVGVRELVRLGPGQRQVEPLTSGLEPAELDNPAARPSMGKTALALNIAENVALG